MPTNSDQRGRRRDTQRGLRLLALTAVTIGLLLLAAAAFILSYSGMNALARQAGVSTSLARIYPLLFDAMLLVAGSSVLALRGAGLISRIYAWICLIALLGGVAAGSAVHAAAILIPHRPAALGAAIIPWVLVLIGFGLLLALLRHARLRRLARLGPGAGQSRRTDSAASPAGTTASPAGPPGSPPGATADDEARAHDQGPVSPTQAFGYGQDSRYGPNVAAMPATPSTPDTVPAAYRVPTVGPARPADTTAAAGTPPAPDTAADFGGTAAADPASTGAVAHDPAGTAAADPAGPTAAAHDPTHTAAADTAGITTAAGYDPAGTAAADPAGTGAAAHDPAHTSAADTAGTATAATSRPASAAGVSTSPGAGSTGPATIPAQWQLRARIPRQPGDPEHPDFRPAAQPGDPTGDDRAASAADEPPGHTGEGGSGPGQLSAAPTPDQAAESEGPTPRQTGRKAGQPPAFHRPHSSPTPPGD